MRSPSAVPAAAAAAVAVLALTAGCRAHTPEPRALQAAAAPSRQAALVAPTSGATPSATATATPQPSRSPAATPRPRPAVPSYDVAVVKRRLADLHYYVGGSLYSSVMAFQKVQGLPADGSIGTATLAALKAPRLPQLRASSPANRVEVDLTRQVLYVVKGGVVTRILPVSSGSGVTYLQKSGRTARALTPVGWYKIQRRIVGVRKADLGTLYDPEYFYQGWAIHGSNSVPAYPASHGCIRVTRADGTWLLGQIGVGTSVYVYGGTFTFPAGSKAPGTDSPTGDGPTDTPTASPSPTPSATRSPSPTASPSPSASPTP